ncbi:LysE family transporter [Chelatococcus reniformis]|uniref:Lysine transporter LysE n=1 Tax=Chelatococcus reniformis TaxID=1494448 RepID=A0A916X898_9HYPH|nr:LysE family transporter [Chelatococcus reniformis]GGC51179.1 lysine transporter LysE [Chelatococcus reniformis]
MASTLVEYLTLMSVFGLAAVAPGPGFAMVVRQSVVHGRRAGIMTSLGVGAALLVHAAYTLAGLGFLVAHSLIAFSILKWVGAGYLVYVGIKTWRAPAPGEPPPESAEAPATRGLPDARSFGLGFLTNALNPKAVLFFLALFTTLVSATTPLAVQAGYAVSMAVLLVGWFTLVAFFFTGRAVRERLHRLGRWFNRVTGALLVGLGIRLAVQRAVG